MRRSVYLAVLVVLPLGAVKSPALAQTTINTDGDVEAQGFIGDGSQVTGVDADLLDGTDSSAFALDADLQNVEALLLALGTAPIPRTGQATCYEAAGAVTTCGTGIGLAQDGHLQLGVSWPSPRFTINESSPGVSDGTVTDNLTGLIWLENANCAAASMDWDDALTFANALFDGSVAHNSGDCGLSDLSAVGAWRLPNVREMQSLVHYGVFAPALPNTEGTGKLVAGDPFSDVFSSWYWSSSTFASSAANAWAVFMGSGTVNGKDKAGNNLVWPVRSGQ